MGRVPSYGTAVAKAEAAFQETTRAWRRAVQVEYAPEIAAIAALVEGAVYDDAPPGDGSGMSSGRTPVRRGVTVRIESKNGDAGVDGDSA